jgi:Citrate transporter
MSGCDADQASRHTDHHATSLHRIRSEQNRARLPANHRYLLIEHGVRQHDNTIYEECIRVPLIIHDPHASTGRLISEPVQQTAIMPNAGSPSTWCGCGPPERASTDRRTRAAWRGPPHSMMIIVGILRQTGVFDYVAIWAAKRAKGSPSRVMVLLVLITAVASAMLDNVTTVLLIAPRRSRAETTGPRPGRAGAGRPCSSTRVARPECRTWKITCGTATLQPSFTYDRGRATTCCGQ